jgi:hypothetical protein
VVEHVRQVAGGRTPVIIVVTGQFFADGVRRRMREAEADFIYHRAEVQDSASLYGAVLHPEAARSAVPGHRARPPRRRPERETSM